MDALSDLLEEIRFHGRMLCRVEARAPWALSAAPRSEATFHGVVRGHGVLRVSPAGKPLPLGTGDLVILSHGIGHTVADSVSTPASSIERALASARGSPTVAIGGAGRASTLVCGAFFVDHRARTGATSDLPPLFSFLPAVLHVPAHQAPAIATLLDLMAAEADRRGGALASVARLSEALFVHAIRAWTEHGDAAGSAWVGAMREPKIGAALRQIHRDPQRAWTVSTLARTIGMSRSAFAQRFGELVGESPVHYLTRWRIYLASRQLRETTRGVAEIAGLVGYETEASLNKAFKRWIGMPPGAYRRAATRS